MKKEIAEYVDKCLTCQKVKADINFLSIPFSTNPGYMKCEKTNPIYVEEIVQLHEILMDIVSNMDQRFQDRFEQALQKGFGIKLKL